MNTVVATRISGLQRIELSSFNVNLDVATTVIRADNYMKTISPLSVKVSGQVYRN